MTDQEALKELETLEGSLTEAELDALEARLKLRAAALNWTGDPLRQPPTTVLAEVKAILQERKTTAQ